MSTAERSTVWLNVTSLPFREISLLYVSAPAFTSVFSGTERIAAGMVMCTSS
jgi:hypothetical protein